MAFTKQRVKLLFNIALWFLITNVQATPIEYSNLLSSFYKHTAGHDRPIVVVLDNNGNRLDDRDRSYYQNRADDNLLGDRADSGLDDDVKIHDRKLSSNRDSYFSSYNSRNQNRRPRYDDRYNANDISFSNRYNRNEDSNHRNRNADRNFRSEDRNNRYGDRNAMNEDRYNRFEDRNDANEYRYNNNRNVRNRHRNVHMSDKNSAYNDRNNRYSDRNNRYYRNDVAGNRYGRNRNYRNQENRYDRLRNRNDRSRNNYNRNRKEKPIQRTSVVNDEDREVEILERSILRSPLVKTIMQIAEDLALRKKKDSCEESGENDSCETENTTPKAEATDDPCEENSNSCGEQGPEDKNISTRGIVDDYVSDPPPKMCKENKVC